MNKLDPMKVVLSVVDPRYPNDIQVEEIVKNMDLLKAAIKLAERNGLYYYFTLRLRELNLDLSFLDKDSWGRELQKLSALKKTLGFLNDMQKNYGIDYILIKACTKIPHVPRDVDILVRAESVRKIYDAFENNGMKCICSTDVETSFNKKGYKDVDVYSRIQYLSINFMDREFLWDSKVEDKMFGIEYPSLNDEADFILLLVHNLFGHRTMTLLDFLHMESLMDSISIDFCREYADEKGWGAVFDLNLGKLKSLYTRIYEEGEMVSFPYLFDRKFMLKCLSSLEELDKKKLEKAFFHASLVLDRVHHELKKTPLYDSLLAFNTGRRLFNSLNQFVRTMRGDKRGIHERNNKGGDLY